MPEMRVTQRHSLRSYLLVTCQFLCLIGLVISGPLVPSYPAGTLLIVPGLLLGIWAVLVMRIGEIAVLPEPRAQARLVTHGPYRLIRHPMYSSLLIMGLGLVLGSPNLGRALIWLALLATLIAKLSYEEQLLQARFAEYAAYQQRSWRLVPWLF